MTARAGANGVHRVVVLGSLNTDLVVGLPHLPSPGETVIGSDLQTFAGGKGANQAVAAARLGAAVTMVGRVGDDARGMVLLAALGAAGIDCLVVRDADRSTGAALIEVDSAGQNSIAVAPGANYAVDATQVDVAVQRLSSGDVLLLQLEVPVPAVEQAIVAGEQHGARVVLNAAPAGRLAPDVLRLADTVIVNEIEASVLFGHQVADVDSARQALIDANRDGLRQAVITLGELGTVVAVNGDVVAVPPQPINPVDTTGAGDAFVGAFVAALSEGIDYCEAARLGNAAGAAAAMVRGAQSSLPSRADLQRLFSIHWPDRAKSQKTKGAEGS